MTDLVHVPANGQAVSTFEVMASAYELAERIARTDFVPTPLRGKPEAVMACMLAGHEIGIGPIMALSKIHVIEGRPAQAAELMRALVQRAGHEIWFEDQSITKVTICGQRAGSEKVSRVTWTMDDAERAGLKGKQNWRRYPRAMLVARATGELCRMIFADVLGGISYTPEEVEDGDLFEPEPEGQDESPTVPRKAARTRKRSARKATAPAAKASAEPPLPPLPGEEKATTGSGDDATKRAQQIAMRCDQAGVDRHALIAAVTFGQKTSGKEVTGEEGADVLQALHDIKAGRRSLVDTDDGWRLVEVEDGGEGELVDEGPGSDSDDVEEPTGPEAGDGADSGQDLVPPPAEASPPPPSDESTWDGPAWRAYLKSKRVTIADTLRETAQLCRDAGIDKPPALLDDLPKLPAELLTILRGFVDEHAKGGRS